MKTLKCIINKIRKINRKFDNKDGVTWLEYRHQWLLENDNWTCKK